MKANERSKIKHEILDGREERLQGIKAKRKGGKHQVYKSERIMAINNPLKKTWKSGRTKFTRESMLNTAIWGKIGENIVDNELLSAGYQTYPASADTYGIDMMAILPRVWGDSITMRPMSIQVKYHTISYQTTFGKTLKVNITPTYADWIAVPIDRGFIDNSQHVIWYPAELDRKGTRYVREFSFQTPEKALPKKGLYHNQHRRRWACDFYELPLPVPRNGKWKKDIRTRTHIPMNIAERPTLKQNIVKWE